MDSEYERAANRYLFVAGIACLIASLHIGPIALVVWVMTAAVLRWTADAPLNGPPAAPRRPCKSRRTRRR